MAEETPTTINLKVLSPSAEVEGGVTFPDIPTTTSIKELRSRIQDAVPSRPGPERMRLIYRGRVVANENDTLGTVFGVDNVRKRVIICSMQLIFCARSVKAKTKASTSFSVNCRLLAVPLLPPDHELLRNRQPRPALPCRQTPSARSHSLDQIHNHKYRQHTTLTTIRTSITIISPDIPTHLLYLFRRRFSNNLRRQWQRLRRSR